MFTLVCSAQRLPGATSRTSVTFPNSALTLQQGAFITLDKLTIDVAVTPVLAPTGAGAGFCDEDPWRYGRRGDKTVG